MERISLNEILSNGFYLRGYSEFGDVSVGVILAITNKTKSKHGCENGEWVYKEFKHEYLLSTPSEWFKMTTILSEYVKPSVIDNCKPISLLQLGDLCSVPSYTIPYRLKLSILTDKPLKSSHFINELLEGFKPL